MKLITLYILFVFSFIHILTYYANGQEINFEQVLSQGYENNYNIKISKLNLEKTEFTLQKSEGFLNPFFETSVVFGDGTDPTLTNDGTRYIQTNFVLPTKYGIDFYTGARLESTNLLQEFRFNSSGTWLGIKVPLLRGLGENSDVNLQIESAKLNNKASEQQFSEQIISYFSDLLQNYLVFVEEKNDNQILELAVNEASQYKDGIYALAENDELPLVEKNRAKSFLEEKKIDLNNTRVNITGIYYSLNLLIGLKNRLDFDLVPNPSDIIPELDYKSIDSYIRLKVNNLEELIKNTPSYKNISINVKARELLVNNASNQKYNPLDLDIKVSKFGMYQNGAYNINNTISSNYPGYSVLLSLNHKLPIGNDIQQGEYLEQQMEYNLAKTYLDQYVFETSTNVMLQLRTLKQKLNLYNQIIDIVDLQKTNYNNEQLKFKLGNATLIDVLLTFDSYYESLQSKNSLKFEILRSFVGIKYLLGELPSSHTELNNFSLENFFELK